MTHDDNLPSEVRRQDDEAELQIAAQLAGLRTDEDVVAPDDGGAILASTRILLVTMAVADGALRVAALTDILAAASKPDPRPEVDVGGSRGTRQLRRSCANVTLRLRATSAAMIAARLICVKHVAGLDYWVWPGRTSRLGSSLSDHFGCRPDRGRNRRHHAPAAAAAPAGTRAGAGTGITARTARGGLLIVACVFRYPPRMGLRPARRVRQRAGCPARQARESAGSSRLAGIAQGQPPPQVAGGALPETAVVRLVRGIDLSISRTGGGATVPASCGPGRRWAAAARVR